MSYLSPSRLCEESGLHGMALPPEALVNQLYDGCGQSLSQGFHWFKVLGFLSFILFPHPSLLLRAEVNPACQGMLSPLLKTLLTPTLCGKWLKTFPEPRWLWAQ